MRMIPMLAGVALVLASAGVATAAAPSKAQPASSSSSATTFTATITPLHAVNGTATVVKNANGSGTVTLKLSGLRADTTWTADIDGQATKTDTLADHRQLRFASGVTADKVSSDTLRIQLTAEQMSWFLRERAASGVAITVTDGSSQATASFAM
jgi:hypothetical protein